jgi:tRNA (cmo5U34)-methyltransferase
MLKAGINVRKRNLTNEWQMADHVLAYFDRAKRIAHLRAEGERLLLAQIPSRAKRVLDLGTGDGRILSLVKSCIPGIEGVALDFSDPMLELAQKRFAKDNLVKVVKHDLNVRLPASKLGRFDAVVSCLAIHHLAHARKKRIYGEIFGLLRPNGVFCNLERVDSPSEALHLKFLNAIGSTPGEEDPSNKLLDVETQLHWLREIGFLDVDCYWKWLEFALMVGFKPKGKTAMLGPTIIKTSDDRKNRMRRI